MQAFNARPFCHLLLLLACLQSCQAASLAPVLSSGPETEQRQARIEAYVPSPELDAFFRPIIGDVYFSAFDFDQVKPQIESALANGKLNNQDLAYYLLVPAVFIYFKYPALLKYLVEIRGVDLNQPPALDTSGANLQHILLYKIAQDDSEVMRYLLEHGADPEAVKTPLPTIESLSTVDESSREEPPFISERGNEKALPSIEEKVQISQALLTALQSYPLENVKLLVKHGAKIPEIQDIYAHIAQADDIAKLNFVLANGPVIRQETALRLLTYCLQNTRLSDQKSSESQRDLLIRCAWFIQLSKLPLQNYVSGLPIQSELHYHFLKSQGFDINGKDTSGDPAYFTLFSKVPDPLMPIVFKDITNFRENQAGETLFDFAIKQKIPSLAKLLIDHRQTTHKTPAQELLTLALAQKDAASTLFFLAQGINPDFSTFKLPNIRANSRSTQGSSGDVVYLELLKKAGYFEWLKSERRADPLFMFFKTIEPSSILSHRLLSDPVYQFLMKQSLPLNVRDDKNLTPLELALPHSEIFFDLASRTNLKTLDLQPLLRKILLQLGSLLSIDSAQTLQLLTLILDAGGRLEDFVEPRQPTWTILFSVCEVDYRALPQWLALLNAHQINWKTRDTLGNNFLESLEDAVRYENIHGISNISECSMLDFEVLIQKYPKQVGL